MAFSFNLGGDDIDLEDDDKEQHNDEQGTRAAEQEGSSLRLQNYNLGDDFPEDSSTTAFVSPGCLKIPNQAVS
jgi:hypothetical protein